MAYDTAKTHTKILKSSEIHTATASYSPKIPDRELLTLEIKTSTYLYDVIAEASKISESITPTSDVYITCGRKVIDSRAPLCAQEVVEGSVLRIHYRLRGGAPGSGRQPECYSFVEGRCEYGSRCQFYHEQQGSSCGICWSNDHSWEQCIRYGGGQYDPNKDPRVQLQNGKQLELNGLNSFSGVLVSAPNQLSRPTLHLVPCGEKIMMGQG